MFVELGLRFPVHEQFRERSIERDPFSRIFGLHPIDTTGHNCSLDHYLHTIPIEIPPLQSDELADTLTETLPTRRENWRPLVVRYPRSPIINVSAGQHHANALQPGSWRRYVVCFAIVALVVTLATRTFHLSFVDQPTAKTGTLDAKRQHVDSDALEWTAPTNQFILYLLPVSAPHAPPPAEPTLAVIVEDCLYNRPPPLFS